VIVYRRFGVESFTIFKVQAVHDEENCLNLEGGAYRLSRNVGKQPQVKSCVTTQKKEDLKLSATYAENHAEHKNTIRGRNSDSLQQRMCHVYFLLCFEGLIKGALKFAVTHPKNFRKQQLATFLIS
jgi:hypothetical protein